MQHRCQKKNAGVQKLAVKESVYAVKAMGTLKEIRFEYNTSRPWC
jgi:hypothetical protein